MEIRDALSLSYTDNQRVTIAHRLAAEIAEDAARLWVASGYFAPSVWQALGQALGTVEDFRLLLGKDYELANLERGHEETRIAELVARAIADDTQPPRLATRDEAEGVAALVGFLERQRERGESVVRLWDGDGFLHAKAYLLKKSVGIGSANFTGNGLTRNRELVGWRQDRSVVAEVEGWFEGYWCSEDARDYTDELIALLRATPLVSDEYTPYELMIRVLAERYGIDRPRSLEQASFSLKWFQEDAAFRLIRLLNGRARGALLADAVGLGKTYVAMAVIHHYLYAQAEPRRGRGRPVLLVIPASLQGMWKRVLDENGLSWACDVLTTQSLRSDFDVRPYHGADLVVIDEAHRLRGGGVWFRKMTDLVAGGERADERRVLLLTATPVNTGMADLVNLLRVLTKGNRSVWVPEIADYERYLKRVERGQADPFPVLDRSIVRRSRSDILRAQDEARAAGLVIEPLELPERRPVHVNHVYGGAEDLFDVFARTLRALVLAPYDLERFRREQPETVEAQRLVDDEGNVIDEQDDDLGFRPGSLAALCAMGLLVRFQSSLAAIRRSLNRVEAVQRRFGEALALDPPRLLDLQGDLRVRRLLLNEAAGADRDEAEEPDDYGAELEAAWEAALGEMPPLPDPEEYDLSRIQAAVERDRELIRELLAELPSEEEDGKIAALLEALERPLGSSRKGAPGLASRRVLVFTQFRDTARYVYRKLEGAGFHVAVVDGSVPSEQRTEITSWFDPDLVAARETEARMRAEEAPHILVSTDVLAEGHNLQLADTVVNFDLHFNPQIAVQRAGRIDRIGSPHKTVYLVSFLPPERLERHIGLLARLDERFRRIHGLGLGDEQVMPLTADTQVQTLEQIRRLYADDASVLDEVERTWTLGSTDYMRQPLEAFLTEVGAERVQQIPVGVSSVRRLPNEWQRGQGAFLALAGPTGMAGLEPDTYWRFYPRLDDGSWGEPLTDEVEIFRAIACRRMEPRAEILWASPGPTVIDWELLRRAATDLASQLTLERSTAAVAAGASERSRKLRTELRGGFDGLELEGADELLDRLLQVRVEDYDGRSGWRRFDDARRRLRGAHTLGERREAATQLVEFGFELFGAPVEEDDVIERIEVAAEDIRLVAYEALVSRDAANSGSHSPAPEHLFEQPGDQLKISS
ncbi:MAG TPA: helicase-related protein [Gaiellaceae bacterium]|jgi:superfamily II DNA or RNA helicase